MNKFTVGDIVKVARIDENIEKYCEFDNTKHVNKVGKIVEDDHEFEFNGVRMYKVEFKEDICINFGETELELYVEDTESTATEDEVYDIELKLNLDTFGFDGHCITTIEPKSLEDFEKFESMYSYKDNFFPLYDKSELKFPNKYYIINRGQHSNQIAFEIMDYEEFKRYVLDTVDVEIKEIIKNGL